MTPVRLRVVTVRTIPRAPTLAWTIATLASGGSVDLTFTATVLAPTGAAGEYVNVAEVTAADQFDPDSTPDNDDGDQSEDDEDNAVVVPQAADLSLTKVGLGCDAECRRFGDVHGDRWRMRVRMRRRTLRSRISLPGGFSYDAGSHRGW